MFTCRQPARAFTLLEVLIVLCVIGVLGGMLVASYGSNPASQLQAAASVLARDLQYARGLAVTYGDAYKVTFDVTNNKWVLTHSGTNTALDTLPRSPLKRSTDTAAQQTTALEDLPAVGPMPRLYSVWTIANPAQVVSDIEFGPLGNTTRTQPTQIWLMVGSGTSARYISVRINPVTGLYWVENYQATAPLLSGNVATGGASGTSGTAGAGS